MMDIVKDKLLAQTLYDGDLWSNIISLVGECRSKGNKLRIQTSKNNGPFVIS